MPKSAKKQSRRKSVKKIKKSRNKRSKSRSRVRIPVSSGGLFGYHIDLPAKKRRSLLKRLLSKKKATYSEIVKRLNVLVIYNKRRHPETSVKVKRDIDFVHRNFAKYSLTLQHSQKKRTSRKKSKRSSKKKSKRSSTRRLSGGAVPIRRRRRSFC
jgi:hypothetical protein